MTAGRTSVAGYRLLADGIERQRPNLLMWATIALAAGVGVYFSLRWEPTAETYLVIAALLFLCLLLARLSSPVIRLALSLIIMMLIGFLIAGTRANLIATSVIRYHYYGAVQGRITAIDRSGSNRLRLTLDQVVLERTSPQRTPAKLRISLHYPNPFVPPAPGAQVMITASLAPPSGPAEPGGFDFQRYAWFRQIGAVGYSRTPLVEYAAPDRTSPDMRLFRLRLRLAKAIRDRIPGQAGAFAAAIVTGDRVAINPALLDDLRASNLAHLLAISGLHMGLLTGFIFAGLRYGLCLLPVLALRLPVKKIAACGAFIAAFAYLALSGANIATQRAFVMVAVMLLAILLNRRALTLRAVAVAAIIVLVIRPESLITAGFQMSFAATTALVAVFGGLRDVNWVRPRNSVAWRLARQILAVLLSSAIAGAATAPFSAYHFNRLSEYGLLANMLSVPVMGLVVMPSAVIGGLLAPIGLDGPAFFVMGAGIDWILSVASWVARLQGSIVHIAKPNGPILPLISFGFLFVVLWRGSFRFAGTAPILLALILWSQSQRPDILLSANGRLLGVLAADGRALNRIKGNGFAAQNWLENDGDNVAQSAAANRTGLIASKKGNVVALIATPIVYLWDRKIQTDAITKACKKYLLVIAPNWTGGTAKCKVISALDLATLGAIAIDIDGDTTKITGARQITGKRLWSR